MLDACQLTKNNMGSVFEELLDPDILMRSKRQNHHEHSIFFQDKSRAISIFLQVKEFHIGPQKLGEIEIVLEFP